MEEEIKFSIPKVTDVIFYDDSRKYLKETPFVSYDWLMDRMSELARERNTELYILMQDISRGGSDTRLRCLTDPNIDRIKSISRIRSKVMEAYKIKELLHNK